MRIVGGKYKGRKLTPPKNNKVRPTSDSTRESLFNILAHGNLDGYRPKTIEGSSFLDLFCGTGAVGIEAKSRGAGHVCFVDEASESIQLARQNAESLFDEDDLKDIQFIKSKNSGLRPTDKPFDFIFMDPPYAAGLVPVSLRHLSKNSFIKSDTFVIIETDRTETISENYYGKKFRQIFARDYGRTKITILLSQLSATDDNKK